MLFFSFLDGCSDGIPCAHALDTSEFSRLAAGTLVRSVRTLLAVCNEMPLLQMYLLAGTGQFSNFNRVFVTTVKL
jgi:hypothetical protein